MGVSSELVAGGAVRVVRIGRPERRNAVNSEVAEALLEAFVAFEASEDERVAVLTGDEAAFCAGADLKDLPRLRPSGPLGPTRLQLSKPVIAAVEGWCVAGGLELALWCDLRIATPQSALGFPERRWGVPLVDGGTQRLPRIVGLGRALDLILTGRRMDAAEAERAGLVARVVPAARLMEEAMKVAETIAAMSLPAVLAAKEAVNRAFETSLAEGVRFERRVFHALFATHDQKEGMAAFVEKRKPKFENR